MRAEGAAGTMTTAAERLERALEREAPTWGIRPVQPEQRRLRGRDFAVLWGDLSIGLLVILTGALLVPARARRPRLVCPERAEHHDADRVDRVRAVGDEPGGEPGRGPRLLRLARD